MKHLRDSGCINKSIKTGVMLLGGVRRPQPSGLTLSH
jgi:hypothetical protein